MINQKWLATFMCLAKTKHFTLTAEKLHMTQPGVSQHVQKLENQLDSVLLHRHGKQFELTLAGEKLVKYGLAMQGLEQNLQDNLNEDEPLEGACKFACSGALAMQLYPDFLAHQCQYPGLQVSVEAAPTQNIIQDILKGDIDVGIVSQKIDHSELQQLQIGREQLVLILPDSARDMDINFTSLNALGFINHPDGFHFLAQVLARNPIANFTNIQAIKINSYVNQLCQILLPVSLGLGFTVLPERTINTYLKSQQPEDEHKRLHIAKLANPVNETSYFTQKRFRPLPARYEWFKKTIIQQVKQ